LSYCRNCDFGKAQPGTCARHRMPVDPGYSCNDFEDSRQRVADEHAAIELLKEHFADKGGSTAMVREIRRIMNTHGLRMPGPAAVRLLREIA